MRCFPLLLVSPVLYLHGVSGEAYPDCYHGEEWKWYGNAKSNAYVQYWYDCNVNELPDDQQTNIPWAVKYCRSTKSTTWGHGYSNKGHGSHISSPIGARFSMMCMVKKGDGLNLKCLCSNNHKMRICEKTHAADKYIDTKYCHKLATPIYRPVNTACREDIECDEGLYCHVVEGENEGECRTCDKDTVFYCTKWEKEKTISPELSKWGTCPFNSQSCPFDCAHEKGGKCNSKKDCCRGMKCDQGKCIDDPCKKTGDCNSDVTCCPGYGCFNASVAYAAARYVHRMPIVQVELHVILGLGFAQNDQVIRQLFKNL